MLVHEHNSVRYYTFDSFEGEGVSHAVFTRHSGVSPSPWSSLNMGGTVGDDIARVAENKRRALSSFGIRLETVYDVWQVHGTNVVFCDSPRPPSMPPIQADAIFTNRPGVTLLMRFADCVPILLYEPNLHVIGIVHAGWKGTINKIASSAVNAMSVHYGVNPRDILAAIGPAIGPDHYLVGPEVSSAVRNSFGNSADAFIKISDGRCNFDLWAANQWCLQQSGIREIEMANICTACHLDDWFSHRGENGRTGRFGVIISLS